MGVVDVLGVFRDGEVVEERLRAALWDGVADLDVAFYLGSTASRLLASTRVSVTVLTDVRPFWRDDLVAFLLGCSFTFEWALLDAGIPMRHIEQGKNVAMWKTSVQCRPAGQFHGPMVVSMRPIPTGLLSKAVTASARFPGAHGAPVHMGDPAALGIADVNTPDWGDSVGVRAGAAAFRQIDRSLDEASTLADRSFTASATTPKLRVIALDADGPRATTAEIECFLQRLAHVTGGLGERLPFKKGGVCRIDVESLRLTTLLWIDVVKDLLG